jgi:2'-hydroxyisoflavone reductase
MKGRKGEGMVLSRRRFLACSASGALLVACKKEAPPVPATVATDPPKPKRILILGGTGFLGPAIVEAALARGHQVTLFNRGKTRPGLFPTLEKRLGDRDPKKGTGLDSLKTGEWDAVFDDSGYYPRTVTASAELLSARIKQYVYISSISCYREPNPVGGTEDAPLATLADPNVEEMGKSYENYGGLKALCEQAAQRALPGRTTIVRPGFIVGPDDPTGRFTYWPVRFDRGGEIAVPGNPSDPIQIIDVRDLASWLVLVAEQGTTGTFNACGPDKPMEWGRVIAACKVATPTPGTVVWVPAETVEKSDVSFPIWAPATGDSKGFHTWSNRRALAAGLHFRPVEETVRDTLAWYRAQTKEADGRVKLAFSPEDEAKVLGAWRPATAPAAGGGDASG